MLPPSVEPRGDRLIVGFIALVFANGTDRQPLCGNGRFDKPTCRCDCTDFLQPRFKQNGSLGMPGIEAIRDSQSQFPLLAPCDKCLRRQKKIAEGSERTAAFDPNATGSQRVA